MTILKTASAHAFEDREQPQKMDGESRASDMPSRKCRGNDDYSGFSSDPDGTSSASLCYTSSSDGRDASGHSSYQIGKNLVKQEQFSGNALPWSGFSLLLAGADGVAQTDSMLGKTDACVLHPYDGPRDDLVSELQKKSEIP